MKVEEKNLRRGPAASGAVAAYPAVNAVRGQRCSGCGRSGHAEDQCWTLHPQLAPVCRRCGRSGHIMRNCRAPVTTQNKLGEAIRPSAEVWEEAPPISLWYVLCFFY